MPFSEQRVGCREVEVNDHGPFICRQEGGVAGLGRARLFDLVVGVAGDVLGFAVAVPFGCCLDHNVDSFVRVQVVQALAPWIHMPA